MDGPPPAEEDFSALPISDRLAHKNWKARVSAYEELTRTFGATPSENDPAFRPYLSNPDLLKRMVLDANAVAQEKGVECVAAFVKFAGENAARTRGDVVPALVDKCLGSARAGTKNAATELILLYVEVENGGAGIVVSSIAILLSALFRVLTFVIGFKADLLPGLSAKQPKAVAATVAALKEMVRYERLQSFLPPDRQPAFL